MKKNRAGLWIGVIVVLAVGIWLLRGRIHFDWHTFLQQLQLANWKLFGVALALIYGAYLLRAFRWALLLKPTKKVNPLSLVGTQVIGFSAVAIFGRPADPVRPYLVSRRTKTSLGSQIGVYAVERMFDLATNALIFSLVLWLAPDSKTLPHPELVRKAALGAGVVVIAFIVFAVFTRVAGAKVARLMGKMMGALSPKLGAGVEEKILAFREGLSSINSVGSFVQTAALSLVMWLMIVYSYLETVRAFTLSPPLAHMTLSRCMLLMAWSQAASTIQLPVIGWFTQIGLVGKGIQTLFQTAPEPALGCAAMLLVITFLAVIPLGLIWSRFEHVSLKKLTEESEKATEDMHPAEAEFVPEA